MSDRNRRRGAILIELLVVVSASATLLGITGVLLHRMARVGQGERSRAVALASLERLGRDLRADARAATGPAEALGDRLVLPVAGGRRVEYLVRAREADVLRTVLLAGKPEHREIYRRPTGTLARFESTRDGPATVVALVLDVDPAGKPGKLGSPTYRDFRVEAVLGRDARLAGGGSP